VGNLLERLGRIDPELASELGLEPQGYRLQPARRGGLTLVSPHGYVHSGHDPSREARDLLAAFPDRALQLHFGFGLGYLAQQAAPSAPGGVLIFEPEALLVLTALTTDLAWEVLALPGVKLFCNLDRLMIHLQQLAAWDGTFNLVALHYHRRVHERALAQMLQRVKREQNRFLHDRSTHRLGTRLFLESTLRSLPFSLNLPGVLNLKQRFQAQPAVIVSPGPSLERNLCDLVPYRDRVLIFALARTAEYLDRWGIKPHFLVHAEVNDYQGLIRDLDLSSTCLLLAEQCHRGFYQLEQRIFVYQNPLNPLSGWLDRQFPAWHKGALPSGGSVATDAFSIAALCGCDPIVLIGQDLALSGETVYAGDRNRDFVYRKNQVRTVPGYFGGRLNTLTHYLNFLQWYEETAQVKAVRSPRRSWINATEGGAEIAGFERAKLSDVLWRHARDPVVVEEYLRAVDQAPRADLGWKSVAMALTALADRAEESFEGGISPEGRSLLSVLAGHQEPDRAALLDAAELLRRWVADL